MIRPLHRLRAHMPMSAIVLIGIPLLVAALGPTLAPHDPTATIGAPLLGAGQVGPLGTDHLGQDVWSRVLCGGGAPLAVSVAAALAAELVGVAAGLTAGWMRGVGQAMVAGAVSVTMAVPSLVLLGAMVAGFGRSWLLLWTATALVLAPSLVPVVATHTRMLTATPWAEAARAMGERDRSILVRHIAPNLLPTVAADLPTRLLGAIFMVSTAGFLGFGPEPPTADWGLMIAEGQGALQVQPWPVLAPAALLAMVATGVHIVGRRAVARHLDHSISRGQP